VSHDALDGVAPEVVGVLIDWARLVGHSRVWLPDQLIDLSSQYAVIAPARSVCDRCHTTTSARGTAFWNWVRAWGCFPLRCETCAGPLPQWTVGAADE
jgi:hypothetical protein